MPPSKVTLTWTDTGSGQSDYDFYVYRGIVHDTDGSQPADYQSASGAQSRDRYDKSA